MKSKTRKWLLGCAVPFVAIVIIVLALIFGAGWLLRDAVREFETADITIEEVNARFGPAAQFRAEPSGTIAAERIEAFLAVRDAAAPARAELERSLVALSGKAEGKAHSGGWFGTTRAVIQLLKQIAGYLQAWNGAQLDGEVGFGEYYYLYTLAFYSLLDHSPADGPPFKMVNDNGYVFETVESADGPAVRAYRDDLTRRSLNRLLLPVLRGQLEAQAPDAGDEAALQWQAALSAEVAAMEADPHRLPWQQGLPEQIAASLEPYRQQLEASYSEMVNALETGIARRD
jgi:hypothetical protein